MIDWIRWIAMVLSVASLAVAMYCLGREDGYEKGREKAFFDIADFIGRLSSVPKKGPDAEEDVRKKDGEA